MPCSKLSLVVTARRTEGDLWNSNEYTPCSASKTRGITPLVEVLPVMQNRVRTQLRLPNLGMECSSTVADGYSLPVSV